MREKINRLAAGNIDIDLPEVVIKPVFIEQPVRASSVTTVELHINTENSIVIKGLLYSSNYRVRLASKSFGGLKNLIPLEVDASYLGIGDIIEGSIKAVTNAGEFVVPYKFTTFSNKTSGILSELKDIKDFLLVYKEDRESAVRIFEYKDFTEALFMNDFTYRALYNAFSGKNNKMSALEEFFIGCGVKSRIEIGSPRSSYVFNAKEPENEFEFKIRKSIWGYISLNVSSEEDFIQIQRKQVTDTDFENDELLYSFKVIKERLKVGINKASIRFSNIYTDFRVNIEIINSVEDRAVRDKRTYLADKKKILSYMEYRLQYENADSEEKEILPELMQLELDETSGSDEARVKLALLKAETFYIRRKKGKAFEFIESVREDIVKLNKEYSEEFLMAEYLLACINNDSERKESLLKIVDSLKKKKDSLCLFMLGFNLNEAMRDSQALKNEYFKEEFEKGIRSPLLYAAYIKLLNANPAFLHDIGMFELQALNYGLKKDILSEELFGIVKQRLNSLPVYSMLSYNFLLYLYKKYDDEEYLYAICRFIIKADIRAGFAHKFLALALEKDLNISLLYEYYIYTLKDAYPGLVPDKVLEHFKHNNSLDLKYKAVLYENILKNTDEGSKVYNEYIYEIEKFALVSLKNARLDKHLANIYTSILKPEMIDEDLARFLPAILNSYMIRTDNAHIKNIVIVYPELKKELIYPLEDNKSYIPIFSEDAMVLEADFYGNRYAGFDVHVSRIIRLDDILKKCYEMFDSHPMLRLSHTKELLQKSELNAREADFLEDIVKSQELSERFRNDILSKLIVYYTNSGKKPSGAEVWEAKNHDTLIKTSKEGLSLSQRNMLANAFVSMGYFGDVYEMIKKYKCFGLSLNNINVLSERIILEKIFKKDYLLLYIAAMSFREGNRSSVVLDYLCEYYNSDSESMYELLETAITENIETYDLEERLLAQLLFVGDKKLLDQTFAWYVSRKKSNEVLVRAYFGVKSFDYVMYDVEVGNRVIEYLENAIINENILERIPLVYKVAMLKYYSGLMNLSDIRKGYARDLLENLLVHGLEFPFYKDLEKFIDIPNNISDRQMLVYIAKSGEQPNLYSRILRQDEEFKKEDFISMYKNAYIKSKILFDNEIWEYQVTDAVTNDILKAGDIRNTGHVGRQGSRFDLINELMNQEDEEVLKRLMEDFVTKDRLSERIFTLM